jgi:hypothetical protein
MQLAIDKEGLFIPSFNGNKELSATDQITVRYRIPTVAIKNRCRPKTKAKGISAPDGKIDHMEITVERDDIATLNEMLISISSCSYCERNGNKPHAITGVQDLINAPIAFEPLMKEILEEFNNVLDHAGIDEKN